MKEWDIFVLIQEELEMYKAMRVKVAVEARLGNNPKEAEKINEYVFIVREKDSWRRCILQAYFSSLKQPNK